MASLTGYTTLNRKGCSFFSNLIIHSFRPITAQYLVHSFQPITTQYLVHSFRPITTQYLVLQLLDDMKLKFGAVDRKLLDHLH